jgi:hypothetical protein
MPVPERADLAAPGMAVQTCATAGIPADWRVAISPWVLAAALTAPVPERSPSRVHRNPEGRARGAARAKARRGHRKLRPVAAARTPLTRERIS